MLRITLTVLWSLMLASAVGLQSGVGREGRWKQIVLMQSTRDEVERLLGDSESQNPVVYYSIEEGSVQVEYSTGPCAPGDEVGWDVPKWTVVRLDYIPFKSPPSTSSLGLNLAKLRKLPDTSMHVKETDSYVDEAAAVEYWVRADGIVTRIVYSPTKEYDHLLCEKKKTVRP